MSNEEYKIFETSPEVLATLNKKTKEKYPFSKLEVGFSFIVPPGTCSFIVMRANCSRFSKKLGRRFIAVLKEDGSIEVGCVELLTNIGDRL
jgi:hypothetical protein